MLAARVSPRLRDGNEVPHVVRDESPVLTRGDFKLLSVVQSSGPKLLRFLHPQDVVAPPAKLTGHCVWKHLIEP